MKPKTSFIVESVCSVLISPILGLMFAGIVLYLIDVILLTIASFFGIVASLFFDVDFKSFYPRYKYMKDIATWILLAGGTIGGMIYSYFEIKKRWRKLQDDAKITE